MRMDQAQAASAREGVQAPLTDGRNLGECGAGDLLAREVEHDHCRGEARRDGRE